MGYARRRFRVAPTALTWVLGSLVLVLTAAAVPLAAPVHQLALNNVGSEALTVLVYGLVGLVIARRKPRNPIGWIILGILKYRLYDIDRIISRTLAYALVTGTLVGLYAGLVLLATQVLGVHSSVAVAASTLVAAALFNPLRLRVQRAVDRRFNRARYDAEQTVAAFAARAKDAVDAASVRDDLAAVVGRTLEPVHVSVWFNPHG